MAATATAIGNCLSSSSACEAQSTCSTAPWPRSCLTTPIPAWGAWITHARVECCFRCCLTFWIHRLGLSENEAHWRARGVDHYVSQGQGGRRRAAPGWRPQQMPLHTVLHPRFGISRFAHWMAIEQRELDDLNESTRAGVLRSSRYRVPNAWRANGSLVVLNKWDHSMALLERIGATLPRGPVALLYGDDASWTAEQCEEIRRAFSLSGRPLARHFAMNLDESAVQLPHTMQVPIGLNSASHQLPELMQRAPPPHPSERAAQLLCCCMRPWPWRERIFAQLRRAGHSQCNLTGRREYQTLLANDYQHHRFVVSVYGHGRADFREWEALLAGAVPVVQHFDEQDALLADLPVVRVRDWAAVTPTFLDSEWQRLQRAAAAGEIQWTKVYFPYWFAQFTAHLSEPRARRTLSSRLSDPKEGSRAS